MLMRLPQSFCSRLLFLLLLQHEDCAANSTAVEVGKPARVMYEKLSPLGNQLLDLLVHIVDLPGYVMYPLTPPPADIGESHPDFPRSALDIKPAVLRISPWSEAIQP